MNYIAGSPLTFVGLLWGLGVGLAEMVVVLMEKHLSVYAVIQPIFTVYILCARGLRSGSEQMRQGPDSQGAHILWVPIGKGSTMQ